MKYYSLALIAAISFIFVLEVVFPQITDEFSLSGFSKPYQLVTSVFLHADLLHLGYNMIALFFFGLALESAAGGRRFLLVFFLAGIAAGVAAAAYYPASLGASGAISGVIGALVVLRPSMTVFALGVPMPLVAAAAVWLLLDLLGVFFPSDVANMAHIAGLLFGVLAGFAWRKRFGEPLRKAKEKRPLTEKEIDEWEKEWAGR